VTDFDLSGVDFDHPSSRRAREALRTGDTEKNLLKFGAWLTGSPDEAEDLLCDTFYLVCSPKTGQPWDPDRGSFSLHMRFWMRKLNTKERRTSRARREVTEDHYAIDERTEDPHERPDDALAEARALARERELGKRLDERLAPLPRPKQVFALRREGIADCDEIARQCHCKVEEVYDANRQIAYYGACLLAEEREEEARRMKELRARAQRDAAMRKRHVGPEENP
jgi:DNA-directed RNA polymerase specialized sigma24 family protein